MSKYDSDAYAHELRALQIELVRMHGWIISRGRKLLVLFEGRDAAGKDGTIKRIAEHLSPRELRVVAPGKPDSREETEWYYQRFVPHLPAAQEIVLFNRSWYNRAGVEHVMGFCTPAQTEEFLESVPQFERMLVRSGVILLKYYLDITRHEQKRRLRDRERDPLKQWKISPIDAAAQRHWTDYSRARDEMLTRTHRADAPWTVVRADDKHRARLNVIRDILSRVPYKGARGTGRDQPAARGHRAPDRSVVRGFSRSLIRSGYLAP